MKQWKLKMSEEQPKVWVLDENKLSEQLSVGVNILNFACLRAKMTSGFLATIILYNLQEQPVSFWTSVPNEGINQQCAHYLLFMNFLC